MTRYIYDSVECHKQVCVCSFLWSSSVRGRTGLNYSQVLFLSQMVWVVRELVKTAVMGADGVLMTLLKQIAG